MRSVGRIQNSHALGVMFLLGTDQGRVPVGIRAGTAADEWVVGWMCVSTNLCAVSFVPPFIRKAQVSAGFYQLVQDIKVSVVCGANQRTATILHIRAALGRRRDVARGAWLDMLSMRGSPISGHQEL